MTNAVNLEVIGGTRFKGDFAKSDFTLAAKTSSTPIDAEKNLIVILNRVIGSLADDEDEDAASLDPSDRALVQARRDRRSKALAELRDQADQVCAGTLSPDTASDNLFVIRGKYVAALERLAVSLFIVEVNVDKTTSLADDLYIRVTSGLPPPNDAPSPEKQALYVAIDAAETVIKAVTVRIDAQSGPRWWRRSPPADNTTRGQRLFDVYVRKLAGIGRVGLQGPNVQLANLALAGLKAEFVAQQAGRIKNTYIRTLGVACGIAAALCLLLYSAVTNDFVLQGKFWTDHEMFLIAAAGASIGTWLSFSIRRVTLTFEDLSLLEEDLLDPSVRVLFVIALTMTACLLFWTGAMNVEIGTLKTSGLKLNGETAMLVGIFCGIAERALATAISGRATSFVKGIAGGG